MDAVGQPGWPVIRPREQQGGSPLVASQRLAGRADYGAMPHPFLAPPAADIAAWQKYNKSLDPTVLRDTRVATSPVGAATRAPLRPAGQLQRYVDIA